MKIATLSLFALLFSLHINAQPTEIQTLQSPDSLTWGAYGGPKVSMINPVGKTAFMIGGQGGVVLNSQFSIGGFGQGMTGNTEFDGAPYGYDNQLELSMGYGGLFLEYMPCRHKLFHPSIALPIGLGGASVTSLDGDTKISKTSLWSISPRLGFDFNISKSAVVSLFAGYNFIYANDNFMLANDDLSSWEFGIILKLGKF